MPLRLMNEAFSQRIMTQSDFARMSQQIQPRLFRICQSIIGNPDDAADIVQDTFLKLWEIRARLDELESTEGMAVCVAKRKCIDYIRLNHHLSDVDVGSIMEELAADPYSAEEDADEKIRQIDNILASLPDSQQTLLKLRHIEGMDIKSMAKLLSTTEGGIRTALSRARNNVKKIFKTTI